MLCVVLLVKKPRGGVSCLVWCALNGDSPGHVLLCTEKYMPSAGGPQG